MMYTIELPSGFKVSGEDIVAVADLLVLSMRLGVVPGIALMNPGSPRKARRTSEPTSKAFFRALVDIEKRIARNQSRISEAEASA